MIKWILAFTFAIFSINSFAGCPIAPPPHAKEFCVNFEISAKCFCKENARDLPNFKCDDMGNIYDKMTSTFGDLERACKKQRNVPAQECIDSWNCYRKGGLTSYGRYCSDVQPPADNPSANSCLNLRH